MPTSNFQLVARSAGHWLLCWLLYICKLWTDDTIWKFLQSMDGWNTPKNMFCVEFSCLKRSSFETLNKSVLRVDSLGWRCSFHRRQRFRPVSRLSCACCLGHWFIRAGWAGTESKVARNSEEVCKVREKETKPTHEIIELMQHLPVGGSRISLDQGDKLQRMKLSLHNYHSSCQIGSVLLQVHGKSPRHWVCHGPQSTRRRQQ